MPSQNPNFNGVFQDGILVDLDVGYWRGLARNTVDDLGIDAADIPAHVIGLGTKRLIPKEYVAEWASFDGRARYVLENASFRFPLTGAAFVPLAAFRDLEGALRNLRMEFEASVKSFLGKYRDVREAFLTENEEFRSSLEGYYPSVAKLEEHFFFRWSVFTVALPVADSKRVQVKLSRVDLDKAGLDAEAAEEYSRDLRERASSFLDGVVADLRAETVALCQSVEENIASGKVITESTLKRIRGFVERYRTMNFIGDTATAEKLATLDQTIQGRRAAEYRTDEAARIALAGVLSNARKAAENLTDISEVTGAYRRRINLGE